MSDEVLFPVLDFSHFNIRKGDEVLRQNGAKIFAAKMIDILSKYGFLYVTNHGIPQEQIEDIHSLGKEFFRLPFEIKDKYHRKKPHGYSRYQEEIYGVNNPGEHKECFDIHPTFAETYPTEVDNFEGRTVEFIDICTSVSMRVIKLLAAGLNVEPASLFADCDTRKENNYTNIRLLHYPPLTKEYEPGAVRLSEHKDFGLLSILCQDDKRGLEVKLPSGEWVEASPIPGTIIILIGEVLERCTSGKLKGTPHRVPYPEEKLLKDTRRFSVAYFLHAPKDALIPGKDDGSPPETADDIFRQLYNITYAEVEY